MSLRDATESDLNDINEIYNYYVLNSPFTAQEVPESFSNREKWFNRLTENGFPIIVAEIDGRVVGWGSLAPFNEKSGYRFCVENSIYLNHNSISCGIGSIIMNELIKRAKKSGFKTIVAKATSCQTVSQRFHEKHGFKRVGVLENVIFKFNQWSGAVLMQKFL